MIGCFSTFNVIVATGPPKNFIFLATNDRILGISFLMPPDSALKGSTHV